VQSANDVRRQQAEQETEAVNRALRDGHPVSVLPGNNKKSTAVRAAADALGHNRHAFGDRVGRPDKPGLWTRMFGITPDWNLAGPGPREILKVGSLPEKTVEALRQAAMHERHAHLNSLMDDRPPAEPKSIRRFLLTAAQDETPIHQPFWQNLQTYAGHLGAEIMIGAYTYAKGLYEDHAVRSGVFASELVPMIRAEVVDLGPRIVWYGRANILPTATDPLSGWDTATREKSAVFGHAKISLKSVPVMPGSPGKQIMTTGVVTQPNYVERNAGQKAAFHHTLGATIVEVCPDGVHFCRQISANARDGSFQDLDTVVRNSEVVTGRTVEAIVWGDVHIEMVDADVAWGSWGFDVKSQRCDENSGSLLDTLRPQHNIVHDSFNFSARSHHTKNDPHERVKRLAENKDAVEPEIQMASRFLAAIRRQWTKVVHVDSNHNQHLHKWLKDESAFRDPVNAAYWCELNAAAMRAAEAGEDDFLIHEHALRRAASDRLDGVIFLRAGQSYVVCQGTAPVECGMHGDIGPNGARGSPTSFARIVERVNVAHTHSPAIREAVYYAGTSSLLDMKYNSKGPGAWAHSHILNFESGKRSIVTMHGSRWRA
jgi:hypothetical protein